MKDTKQRNTIQLAEKNSKRKATKFIAKRHRTARHSSHFYIKCDNLLLLNEVHDTFIHCMKQRRERRSERKNI